MGGDGYHTLDTWLPRLKKGQFFFFFNLGIVAEMVNVREGLVWTETNKQDANKMNKM